MVLHASPIFGPVRSRRLGVSLGINLLPADGKLCSFDCIYCECGFNACHRPTGSMPTHAQVVEALEARLMEMRERGECPDVLTFAGNGEPTLHPQFPDIVDDVANLRDRYFPEARISVLSNSTTVSRPAVREALLRTDNPIMKLDTASPRYIALVNRPQGGFDVESTIETLAGMGRSIVVQTMFLCGDVDGQSADNTGEEYVEPWLEAIEKISPRQVMIYTIDRETPARMLAKAPPRRLDEIAGRVRAMGIDCSVGY